VTTTVTPAPPPPTSTQVQITWYGSYDNDPKGSLAIDDPVIHKTAGGVGTFTDPLTFASPIAADGKTQAYGHGQVIYVPAVQKYFIREDSCAKSWTAKDGCGDLSHVDLYIGNPSATKAVLACEDALTPATTGEIGTIIVNPASNLPVNPIPLWDESTGKCSAKLAPTATPTPTTTPVPVTTPAPTTTPAPPVHGRAYPMHTKIVATTFWVGEIFDPKKPDGSQVCSTYDSQWAYHWSGIKTGVAGKGTDCEGAPLGGCDGIAAKNKCDTEVRKPDNGYFPSQAKPKENPFYLDLPYDDINDATAAKNRGTVVPWAHDPGLTGGASIMKNRWVKITGPNGKTCYGQNEDAGPSSGNLYHDSNYVFGNTDARPVNKEFNGAGMDVSPALNGCLGFKDLDGDSDLISWQWVDDVDVPPGPWKTLVTTSPAVP
jgi:hypothetical protein